MATVTEKRAKQVVANVILKQQELKAQGKEVEAKEVVEMVINDMSYRHFIRMVMAQQYATIPVCYKLTIERGMDGLLQVTNMVEERDGSLRFCYGTFGDGAVPRGLTPSDFKTFYKVAVEEEKDGKVINHKVMLGPEERNKFYDEIVFVHFGDGVAHDLMTNGFMVDKEGYVTINEDPDESKIYDGEGYKFVTPDWGPSNEKHNTSFFFNGAMRSADDWFTFCDDLTGGAFEYSFSIKKDVKKILKDVTRWGNSLPGSIEGPSIDLSKDYICIIEADMKAADDFDSVPDYVHPGSNIQDGGDLLAAELLQEWALTLGIKISVEDICKVSPQSRFTVVNSKVMHTVMEMSSLLHMAKSAEKLYGDKVKYYGNRNGRLLMVTNTDGCKLINYDALEKRQRIMYSSILAFAKVSNSNTSGQLLDKYIREDAPKTAKILSKLYRESLEKQVINKTEADFDPRGSFNDNMLALMGTDALQYKEVVEGLTKDLFKFGVSAVGKLKVKSDIMYSHAKFDMTYDITMGTRGYTLHTRYLAVYNCIAIEAFNPDILWQKRKEIAAIRNDKTLTDDEKEMALDRLLTCITIKYPSAGPEEFEIIRYLTREELQKKINSLHLEEIDYQRSIKRHIESLQEAAKAKAEEEGKDYTPIVFTEAQLAKIDKEVRKQSDIDFEASREELQKYWDRAQYGVTVYAAINIMKHKLAGMDIDFDATAADFSELKEILITSKARKVDLIDYKDKAHK